MKKVFFLSTLGLIILLSIKLFFSLPTIFNGLDFDAQNLIVWKFAAFKGLVLYRDVFYPYGILGYFLYVVLLFNWVQTGIFMFLLIFLFFALNKILSKTFYSYLAYLLLLFFLIFITGAMSFIRYGIIVVLAMYIGIWFFNNLLLSRKILFFLGLLSGLLFFLVTDQGVYLFVIASIFIVLSFLKLNVFKVNFKSFLFSAFKKYSYYFYGLILGCLPFLIVLSYFNILDDFTLSFLRTVDISLFAKTPFFHSLKSFNGSFNFILLYLAVCYLSYSLLFNKKKINERIYVLLSLAITLFLLEQKSIMRSIDNQINFIGFILGIIMTYDILSRKIIRLENFTKIIAAIFIIIFFSVAVTFPLGGYTYGSSLSFSHLFKNPKYAKVIEKVSKNKNYNGKIFSFPSDPVFYILTGQNPPYYFTSYDASPRYAQKTIVDYIRGNNINYVVYNKDIASIQDGVPDYVRVPYELSYIFNNFFVFDSSDNFILMRRGNVDSFGDNRISAFASLRDHLLNINLEKIPLSEGIHKRKQLPKHSEFSFKDSSSNLDISSDSTFIIVYNYHDKGYSRITLKTGEGTSTSITFKSCPEKIPCVINLSNVPLFYRSRIIKEIDFDTSSIEEIRVVKMDNKNYFW